MICDRCGKNVSSDSLKLHERTCGGVPHADTPEEMAAHKALLTEIGAMCGHGRAPTKGELRRAAINVITALTREVDELREALTYIAETSEDSHVSRKAFEALSRSSGRVSDAQ